MHMGNNKMCTAYKYEGRIYFDKRKLPGKGTVLRRIGVRKGSFAGGMVSRMYDYYFSGATVFRKEYKKYYSKEFDTLADFIEQKYDIERSDARKYAEGNYAMKNCSRT